jgi:hypothetical protein
MRMSVLIGLMLHCMKTSVACVSIEHIWEASRNILQNWYWNYIGFELLTTVVMKSSVFWDIMPCSSLKVNRHFGGTCLLSCFLLGLFFDCEDRGSMFLRNVCWLWADYRAVISQKTELFDTELCFFLCLSLFIYCIHQQKAISTGLNLCSLVAFCRIWTSHNGCYEEFCSLEYNAL